MDPVRTSVARMALPEIEAATGVNRVLDAVGRPRDELFGCAAPAYLVLGVTGVLAGFVALVTLAVATGGSLAACVALTVASLVAFVIAGLIRQAVGLRARHVLLEDTILVGGGTRARVPARLAAPAHARSALHRARHVPGVRPARLPDHRLLSRSTVAARRALSAR